MFTYDRMCSLTIECVLLPYNVFTCDRMCSLTIECVLLQMAAAGSQGMSGAELANLAREAGLAALAKGVLSLNPKPETLSLNPKSPSLNPKP